MAIEYVADFETTSQRIYDIKTRKLRRDLSSAWVCAWAMMPVMAEPDPIEIVRGRSIDSFMEYCAEVVRELPAKQRQRGVTIFTHNLRFDSDFVMYWLLSGHGTVDQEVRENVLYSFRATWDGVSVMFRDSLKIFPQRAEALGELYGIKKLKGSWDYEKYRTPETPITIEEWEYVHHDVMIISRALADYRARGYMENTQASIAYNDRLRRTYPRFNKTQARRLKKVNYEKYRQSFPWQIRPLEFHLHKHLLMAYFGGISYVNPAYANRDLYDIDGYDVHSMYPKQMDDMPLPVGEPLVVNNPSPEEAERLLRSYKCVIADFEDLSLELKGPEYFPALMFPTDPYSSIRMQGKIIKCRNELACLTGIDYEIMRSEYNILSGRIVRLYLFRTCTGQYHEFVEYWMQIKSDSDRIRNDPASTSEEVSGARTLRALSKVMMNSSYGKDGTKLMRTVKRTYMSDEGLLESDDTIEIADVEYYLPSAIFITAWARRQLWTAVKACRVPGKSFFVYCDTDSVKVTQEGAQMLRDASDVEIDDYKLGTWGYEGTYITARFVRQKTYSYTIKEKNGSIGRHYVVCGAPDDIKSVMDIDEFYPGMIIDLDTIHAHVDDEGKQLQGRLLPIRVRGGVILEETGFQISKIENWDEYTGRNMPIDYDKLVEVLSNKEVT